MDGNVRLTILFFLFLLIGLSAYFSAAETAFSSYNKSRIKTEAEDDNKRARRVLELNNNYEKLISTILIGNNIVNIVATSLSTILFVELLGEQKGVTISTVVMTLAVLVFGEITPKTLAKRIPEKWAKISSGSLEFIIMLLTPLTAVFNVWQRFVLKFMKNENEATVTEDEIITVVEEAANDGEIDEQESELIKNVIKFSDLDVNDILTPRVDVAAVEIGWDKQRIAEVFAETEFSRLPVYEENIDSIVGILYQKDFYNDSEKPVSELIKPVKFIFASMKISRLLKLFQESKCHMVVVNDEYGGTEGIVTLEDVLESLVGEIYDEHDVVVEEIVEISGVENSFLAMGSMGIDNFFEFFNLEEEDEDPDITTLSGFAAHNLGKIPDEGDFFEYKNLKITITKTDSNRVVEATIVVNKEQEEALE